MSNKLMNIKSYTIVLEELKTKIRQAQYKAYLSVNKEMVLLYWDVGIIILEQQEKQGWGAKVIDKLSMDLTRSFPGIKGLSPRNLKYMRQFASLYPDRVIVQETLAQLTWYHIITLMDKVKNEKERLWYAHQVVQNSWSRNVLVHQIESHLYQRQKGAHKINNFQKTLPAPQSDLAH